MATVQVVAGPIRSNHPHPLGRWMLGGVMLLVLVVGGFEPLAGWVVPLVMLTGVLMGFARGRYACGNLCPRGGFYDSWFLPLGGKRPIPAWVRHPVVRWGMVGVLMGMMVLMGAQDPTSLRHWGQVFWQMCLVTTLVGVVLGVIYSPRTWCSLCPIGTLSKTAGLEGDRRGLRVDSHCVDCRLCDRRCPMQIAPMNHLQQGQVHHGDCIQCGACVVACPRDALRWGGRRGG